MNIIKQDILKIEAGLVCHQVNCMGVYGGLASAVFKKYPKAKTAYTNLVKSSFQKWKLLGDVQFVKINDKLIIANMFAQYDVGTEFRKTEYGSFRVCLDTIASNLKYPYPKVHFPYLIGCGLGGGEWNIVEDMIKESFWETWDICICRID